MDSQTFYFKHWLTIQYFMIYFVGQTSPALATESSFSCLLCPLDNFWLH